MHIAYAHLARQLVRRDGDVDILGITNSVQVSEMPDLAKATLIVCIEYDPIDAGADVGVSITFPAIDSNGDKSLLWDVPLKHFEGERAWAFIEHTFKFPVTSMATRNVKIEMLDTQTVTLPIFIRTTPLSNSDSEW